MHLDPGPRVDAKKNYIDAGESALRIGGSDIISSWAAIYCVGVVKTDGIATIYWQTSIPKVPQMRGGRRPNFSIVQKDTGVENPLVSVKMNLIICIIVVRHEMNPKAWT
jgi:hypothetical protein